MFSAWASFWSRPGMVSTRCRMLRQSITADVGPAELRRRVTSPNGTTQAAIETFQAGGFETLVARAVHAATVRGGELSAAND